LKKNILPFILIFLSVVVATLLWNYISIPYNPEKQILGDSYLKNLHNPLNDILRFIFFLSLPVLTLAFYYQLKEKNIFTNFKKIIFFNYNNFNYSNEKKDINFFSYVILSFLLLEFFSLNFLGYNFDVDFFHEGMWLTASQNLKINQGYWSSSYIVRGLFGDFYPYFLWNTFGVESVGVTRLFQLVIIFLNKLLLLMIARNISLIVNLKKEIQIIYFLFLSITFLSFQGYGSPIFLTRSFLLLLFILIFLKFLDNYKSGLIYIPIIGFFSSVSFFWYIDIGFYINIFIFILFLFFLIKFELKNILVLSISIILGWLFFYLVIPKEEFSEFLNNSYLIFSTLNYIHGLIFPTPFISLDARSTRALLIFLITALLITKAISKNIEEKEFIFFISLFFLILISCLYFNYGLSRSDSSHIKVAQGFIYIPFFSILFFYILKNLNINVNKSVLNKFKKFKVGILLLIVVLIFIEKKYEDKKIINLPTSFNSIKELINFEDKNYLSKDYQEFIQYYADVSKSDNCITIFTNEIAIYYFLKKPSCSKYFNMWTATPEEIQSEMIKDFKSNRPKFILYESEKDVFKISQERLLLVNAFILENYVFYEKFKYWDIYKIKSNN
tara:strand:- start:2179 stop:4017 length:1839 start_codon:yes stop_codon:yes gene_type:complete